MIITAGKVLTSYFWYPVPLFLLYTFFVLYSNGAEHMPNVMWGAHKFVSESKEEGLLNVLATRPSCFEGECYPSPTLIAESSGVIANYRLANKG